jgi:hypothetical protein
MFKFNLLSQRIFALLGLFLVPIIATLAIGSTSVAVPTPTIAQIITSPGLTTPTPTQPPTPLEESPIEIPVPPPQRPLPSGAASPPTFATNHTNRLLSSSERDKISSYLQSRNLSSSSSVNNLPDPRFILHDTSFIMSPSILDRERRSGRGPLGLGVNAFLPPEDATVMARPNFYTLRRPTTTEFEKASDILDRTDREQLLRQVWKSTNEDDRTQALDTALANLDLSSAEITAEQKGAREKLAAASGRIYTTATWAVETICASNVETNSPTQLSSIREACEGLENYFRIRNSRVKSSVAIEILQVGARSSTGNQNTCSARNLNIATLPNPPYSDHQYQSATSLYLRSALATGKFPQTTTHFALDTFDPAAHCDPRCFNLTQLYNSISSVMGHAQGSTYGITPSYGTQGGTNNIWWDDNICHGTAP